MLNIVPTEPDAKLASDAIVVLRLINCHARLDYVRERKRGGCGRAGGWWERNGSVYNGSAMRVRSDVYVHCVPISIEFNSLREPASGSYRRKTIKHAKCTQMTH